MGYSFDLSKVNFAELKESGVYSKELIESLERENFECLEMADVKDLCKNKEFIEPILYACINSRKAEMYQIYAHLEEGVQFQLLPDYNLSCNILQNAPEVIKDTPLAEDEKTILANVNSKPEIVRYISNDLMDNPSFVSELAQKDPAVVQEMVENHPVDKLIAANPSLAKNPAFMAEAISKDINAIKFADKEMLNNYDVFKEAAMNNKEVIKYALQNSDEIGLEALNGIKDGATESLKEDVLNSFTEEEREDKDIKRKIAFYNDENRNPKLTARALSHRFEEKEHVTEADIEKLFNLAEMERIALQRKIENPEYVVVKEDMDELINYRALKGALDKSPLKDDERWLNKVKEQKKFAEKIRKEIKKNLEKANQQSQEQTQEQAPDHNAELSVSAITLVVNDKGIEKVITYDHTTPQAIELTPEQMKQLEADLAARSVQRENVQEVEAPKRGITALREQSEEKTGPEM